MIQPEVYNQDKTYKILSRLVTNGWVPLSNCATLLGYSHATVIYQRQHTKRAIPTIRVGGQNRVYEDTVISILEERQTTHTEVMLSLYKRIKGNG